MLGLLLVLAAFTPAELAVATVTKSCSLLQTKGSAHLGRGFRRAELTVASYLMAMPHDIMQLYKPDAAEQAKMELERGTSLGINQTKGVFDDVRLAFPLMPPYVDHAPRVFNVEGSKNIVGLSTIDSNKCVVYAAGIASESGFEEELSKSGCEVHAFDCTINASYPSVSGKHFSFHNWCLGKNHEDNLQHDIYNKLGKTSFEFKSLKSTMDELGHSYVSLLKFDIEGYEWDLFKNELFTSARRPRQLSFELHTDRANRFYVPHDNVRGKDRHQVDQLFLQLYDMNYRVVSKEINKADAACAEFVLLNIGKEL
jgi:hypothetical protein